MGDHTIEFLREAAFHIVLRDGCDALTRRGPATELGIPDSSVRHLLDPTTQLATLAAAHYESRRRRAWTTRHHTAPPTQQVLDQLLPQPVEAGSEGRFLRLAH